ncbi:MAG: hypothetical protein RIT43_152 [Bacteroidota bacterium]|jgi:hypothetical protein
MKTIIKNATATSPYLELNGENGTITVKGRAIDYNPNEFWATIFDWMADYLENPLKSTTINLHFEYINTLSTKKLFVLLKLIEFNTGKNTNIQINWISDADDEDMIELGQDINSLLKSNMNFVRDYDFMETHAA